MLPERTTLKERLLERWATGVAQLDEWLGPRFEGWMTRPWFPMIFWMAIFAMAVWSVLALRGRPWSWSVLVAALAGALFGSRLGRMSGTLRGPLDREERAWAKGDIAAAHAIGMAYFQGAPGVPRCRESARAWFQAGAEAGDRRCMTMLAECLRWGLGGNADPAGAEAWMKAARPGAHEGGSDNGSSLRRDG